MADHDSTVPILQLVGACFSNFLSRMSSRETNSAECRYYTNFKWPYFRTAGGYGHMIVLYVLHILI